MFASWTCSQAESQSMLTRLNQPPEEHKQHPTAAVGTRICAISIRSLHGRL